MYIERRSCYVMLLSFILCVVYFSPFSEKLPHSKDMDDEGFPDNCQIYNEKPARMCYG